MKQEIIVRVKTNPTNPQCAVVADVFNEDGTLFRKFGLNREGSWIEIPEKVAYPEECYLPVILLPPFPKEQTVSEPPPATPDTILAL